jgi:hypothetical protein
LKLILKKLIATKMTSKKLKPAKPVDQMQQSDQSSDDSGSDSDEELPQQVRLNNFGEKCVFCYYLF